MSPVFVLYNTEVMDIEIALGVQFCSSKAVSNQNKLDMQAPKPTEIIIFSELPVYDGNYCGKCHHLIDRGGRDTLSLLPGYCRKMTDNGLEYVVVCPACNHVMKP